MVRKMSFDVNVLSTKPVIKPAASMQNDGGGGNLGYMSQGRKEEKEERKYLDESIFMKQEEDIFLFGKEPEMPEEKFQIPKFILEIFNKIKKLFKKDNLISLQKLFKGLVLSVQFTLERIINEHRI